MNPRTVPILFPTPHSRRSLRSTIGMSALRSLAVVYMAAAALGGCAKSPRIVTLDLYDALGSPVEAAHVRAIALRTNDLPLPVSFKNLASLDRAIVSGVTDERGAVQLALRDAGAYLVEVTGTPFGELAGAGPWRWKLAPHARSLTPVPEASRDGASRPETGPTLHLLPHRP